MVEFMFEPPEGWLQFSDPKGLIRFLESYFFPLISKGDWTTSGGEGFDVFLRQGEDEFVFYVECNDCGVERVVMCFVDVEDEHYQFFKKELEDRFGVFQVDG